MIIIESLNDYVKIMGNEEYLKLATKIFKITEFLCNDYPNYKEWYYSKQLPGIINDERNIIFVRNTKNNDEIIAVSFLKRNIEERKICTLYVLDKYQGFGIGTLLIDKSFE